MSDEKRHISRRADDSVSKAELGEFVAHIDRRLGVQDEILVQQNTILEGQNDTLKSINQALFAKDSENPNGQPGLMTTARNIDSHITTVCRIGRWLRNTILSLAGLIVTVVAAARALGVL